MSINIGLDIGAVSLKLAAIGGDEDRASFEALTAKSEAFFAGHFPEISGLAGRPLVLSRYRRIQGSPIQSTFDLLRELYEQVPERAVEGIRVTGSGSQLIAKILGIYFENELRALAKGVRLFYPEVRTVFEMGGETSKYVRLEPSGRSKYLGIVDYSSSGDCAAGTGSFIDQQASRLLYQVEQVGAAACQASCAARIAGRCSVFAKSDMIHAQQKGYTTDQILRGLCDAVARNFKSAIVKGREVELPVAFIGGVALNGGVQAALREAFKFADGQFIVPELYAWMSALGAAIFESEETRKRSFKRIHQLEQHAQAKQTFACSDPLSMEKVVLLRHRVQEQTPVTLGSKPGRKVEAYLGIDIGSVSTNLVVIDHEGKLLHEIYLRTQGRPIEVVSAGLKEIEEKFGDRLEVRGVGLFRQLLQPLRTLFNPDAGIITCRQNRRINRGERLARIRARLNDLSVVTPIRQPARIAKGTLLRRFAGIVINHVQHETRRKIFAGFGHGRGTAGGKSGRNQQRNAETTQFGKATREHAVVLPRPYKQARKC